MRIHNTFDESQYEWFLANNREEFFRGDGIPLAVYTGRLSGKAAALCTLKAQMVWEKVIEGDCETEGLSCLLSHRRKNDWRMVLLLREFNTKTRETRYYINYWPKGLIAVRTTDWLEVLENNA